MKLMKTLVSAGVIGVLALAPSAVSAATLSVKDGARCTKAGRQQTSAGVVFTCTKVGKKLVWKSAKGSSTNPLAGGFGNGTHIVGSQVKAGRYVTTNAGNFCYWERLSGFSGSFDEIISNEIGSGAHLVVDILSTDKGFKTNGCGTWVPYSPKPAAKITDGDWVVNDEIAAGLWQSSESKDCYWARLRDFQGSLDSIITNELSSNLVQIEPTDVGFSSSRCGTWTKVG